MNIWLIIVVAWLGLSALVQFGRCMAQVERRYTPSEGFWVLVETGFVIWIVMVKL